MTMTPAVSLGHDGLVVTFPGHKPVVLSWMWIRDHDEAPHAQHPDTGQREVDTFSIDPGVAAVAVVEPGDDPPNTSVCIQWPDGPNSVLSHQLLADAAGAARSSQTLWDAQAGPSPTAVHASAVLDDDRALVTWMTDIERWGYGLISGLDTTADATAQIANRLGPPRTTVFGTMWPLSADLTDHSDSAYSTTFLEPHTDATYMHDAPGLQLFACLERTGTGGGSILVDGFAAAERLRATDPEAFAILTRVSVPGRYTEPGVHLRAERPTIQLTAAGQVRQVTINNYDRAPFLLPADDPDGMAAWYDAYSRFHAQLQDPQHWTVVQLRPGDVLAFDNWRVLHGRQEYTGVRVFEGCYHSRETFEATLHRLRST